MKKDNMKKKAAPLEGNKAQMDEQDFAFDKQNYKWLLIALAFIFIGFILMIGGGSDDPNVFNDGMFNFQRITLSPILLMAGYIIGVFAIMKKPKSSN